MGQIEKTLVRQPFYRRLNIYPGQAQYREVDSDPVITSADRMIVILNTELFPDGKLASEIHVVVDWKEGEQPPVHLTSKAPPFPPPNTPDNW